MKEEVAQVNGLLSFYFVGGGWNSSKTKLGMIQRDVPIQQFIYLVVTSRVKLIINYLCGELCLVVTKEQE